LRQIYLQDLKAGCTAFQCSL